MVEDRASFLGVGLSIQREVVEEHHGPFPFREAFLACRVGVQKSNQAEDLRGLVGPLLKALVHRLRVRDLEVLALHLT
jgi:hypothetical protein